MSIEEISGTADRALAPSLLFFSGIHGSTATVNAPKQNQEFGRMRAFRDRKETVRIRKVSVRIHTVTVRIHIVFVVL
jgi:hypothetical protein